MVRLCVVCEAIPGGSSPTLSAEYQVLVDLGVARADSTADRPRLCRHCSHWRAKALRVVEFVAVWIGAFVTVLQRLFPEDRALKRPELVERRNALQVRGVPLGAISLGRCSDSALEELVMATKSQWHRSGIGQRACPWHASQKGPALSKAARWLRSCHDRARRMGAKKVLPCRRAEMTPNCYCCVARLVHWSILLTEKQQGYLAAPPQSPNAAETWGHCEI
ncbi:unnamed protein product [Durusdinium trenchii]|uniref:Uncharacterized protein n=1 Tax=Durusdinium trenchii TaxID=1381693 RepID=A0ABP0J2E2_9DINO